MIAALPLAAVFGTGVASSIGPCLAPRAAALTSVLSGEKGARRAAVAVAFVFGLCGGYIALASIAGGFGYLSSISRYTYDVLAAVLLVSGLATLVREPQNETCAARCVPRRGLPLGAIVLTGFASVGIGSSCCGPLGLMLAGVGTTWTGGGIAAQAAFTLGHAVPLLAIAGGFGGIANVLCTRLPKGAGSTVGGALSLAFAGYYALLA